MISVWSNYGVANYSSYLFHLLLWREWEVWKPINRVNCPLGESRLFPLIKKAPEVFNSECKWSVEKSKAQWNLSHRDCTHFYVQCLVLQLKLPDHPVDLTIHNLHKANKQERYFWALWMCNTESNIALLLFPVFLVHSDAEFLKESLGMCLSNTQSMGPVKVHLAGQC